MRPAESAAASRGCRLCGGALGDGFVAREQHLGLLEPFGYARCEPCDVVQLVDEPADMGRFYPDGYYAWSGTAGAASGGEPARTRLARRLVARAMLRGGAAEALARRLRGWLAADFPAWLVGQGAALRLSLDTPVLDVGCGAGTHLRALARFGFSRLAGVDAYLPAPRDAAPGVPIHVGEIDAIGQPYGVVMFHHSLEHMRDPVGALRAAGERLLPEGRLLVRIPVLGAAWRVYGAHWVQLDAPRHRFLFGVDGFLRAARAAGLEAVSVRWDSGAFQFWGSEQYRMGIALAAAGSHARDPAGSPFDAAQIAAWQASAEQLNAAGDGDQACFVLRRASAWSAEPGSARRGTPSPDGSGARTAGASRG
jgi:SAM-dependent methyltransferase